MGDEPRFSEKWDFRRKENDFEDSSSDDPDSNSTQDPIIHNPNLVLASNQIDSGTKTVTREDPVNTRKRRSKKDECKAEKAKQVRRRKPKTVCAEENKKKDETVTTGMDGVGMFMETLLDDLTASRESLMDWMKTELYGSSDQNVASPPPLKKRAVGAVAAQRPVRKRRTKKQMEEEEEKARTKKKEEEEKKEGEKQSKPGEKSPAVAHNGQDLDCNAGLLDRFLESGQGGLGRNYFPQPQEGQEALVTQTEMENSKNKTVKSQKSIVLAIKAPNLNKKQKKTSEANNKKNRSSIVESLGPETQNDHNLVTPYVPTLSSSSSLQSFPVPSLLFPKLSSSSLLPNFPVPASLFPSSSEGINSIASNSNFQLRQPVAQIADLSEFQTGDTGGQGFGNPLFHNNGYFSGFPAAFQPNLMAGGYNFPAPVNPATSQQRDNNIMFGGLRMAGGAIRFPGNRFAEVGISNTGLSDYNTSSGR